MHFGGAPSRRLADVDREVDHVFCATELQSGYHLYLAPMFVYSYLFGLGTPGDLSLARAVQCSACLPFAFAPRTIPAGPHRFTGVPTADRALRGRLVLADGGIYDNMADQWLTGLADRLQRNPALPVTARGVDHVIVVNAGGARRPVTLRAVGLPLIGEVRTLRRTNDIMYAGTTSQRRRDLVRRSEAAERTGGGPLTAVLQTTQTPYTAADGYAGDNDQRAERAREALSHLERSDPDGRQEWARRAGANAHVPTVLGKLGAETTVNLLEHAYLVAMYNLHTVLGYPLLPRPRRASFEELVARG